MVLLGRIELPTSALPRMRSTTELQQHTISADPSARQSRGGQARALAARLAFVKDGVAAFVSARQRRGR